MANKKNRADEIDITEGYDDGEPEVLSFAEQERRIAAFEQEVSKRRLMLRKPKNYPAKERVEAAYWLGEAGDPQAIPELVLVYNKDKTKGMREAAGYSLGMFKALKDAMDDPEMSSEVDAITERIVFRGQYGKRYAGANLLLPQIGLVLSFVVLLVVGYFAGEFSKANQIQEAIVSGTETAIAPTPTPDTFEAAATDLTAYYSDLDSDARVLQGQMAAVTRGESQDCTISFTNPPSYTLSQARQSDTNLVEISTQLNTLHDQLVPVREAFQNACNTGLAINRQEGLTLAQSVIAVQNGLRTVQSLFTEDTGIEAPPTLELSPTPTAPAVSPTPEPTLDFAVIRPHFDTLNSIIVDMTDTLRGNASRQEVFWQNILDFGSSEGCDQPPISVPEDYALPTDIGEDFPELANAASSVNTGLALLRESVATFPAACSATEPPTEAANIGLSKAQLAIAAFTEAQTLLSTLQQ
jgi:hypothetical protein